MSHPEPNYFRALYGSFPNLLFIGIMVFLSLAIHPALLFLLVAGELSLLVFGQTAFVQKLLRTGAARERKREQEKAENQILAGLTEHYKRDFSAIKQLCLEIEKRTKEIEQDKASGSLLIGIIEKLSTFRLEYIHMLRGHFLLANRNYDDIRKRLEKECRRLEDLTPTEESEQVRITMDQNVQILRQRINKARQLSELVRLIEARLRVVSDSLQLIQDEVYSMTDVRGISGIVDELLLKLEMNDEFRSYYEDMLSDGSPALAGLEATDLDNRAPLADGSRTATRISN